MLSIRFNDFWDIIVSIKQIYTPHYLICSRVNEVMLHKAVSLYS